MTSFLKALAKGMLLMLIIVGVTALGVLYPVPDNYIVGHDLDYRQ